LALVLALPGLARAHGELLIRIAAVTRQIATNGTAPLYLQRGELYREDRNWPGARADYDTAARLDPALAEVDFCRAKLLEDEGDFVAAKRMFDVAAQRAPTNGAVLIARARLLRRIDQPEAAVADFERGMKPECYLDWSQTLAGLGRTNEALRRLDEGVATFGSGNVLQVYAITLELQSKDTNAALARLEKIIRQAPRKETWLLQRGDLQAGIGRFDDARQSYDAALAATKLLPPPLQRSPPTQRLQARIAKALAAIPPASTNHAPP
jgi:tetratricopeptide (TPR) repeat protein